ncbi:ATP-binding protein [Enterococcus faecalis]|uniref:ATP-binding protein n=1 Tax=Enterococcus faecalis TaxID=1351 RepID=UPI0019FB29B2|nr:ATP-binding protein [Enterococcus faecalis]EGO7832333.1 ATP-binding protein [Enterococcus faecalis]EGO8121903.1 ATP-binding protein [Enterococcus faecalis]EKK0978272.1 ATP-binding protein [Enterococcus faecalis]EKZ0164248.1 ATP-binding protein [Enterococcus faecalis]EKZ0220909.1 ATP-binding protein [Enterococcus faecalis]
MDLLKGLPDEVAKHLVEHSKGIIETDEYCEIHPRHPKLMLPNGNLVCPVCYGETRDGEVRTAKSKEYYENSVDGRRQYLKEQSIVSNKMIFDKGFKTFFTRNEHETKIRKEAESLVMEIAASEPMNIYLQGAPGSGKSHLSMAMLKNANSLANGKRCMFVNFPALQQKIRASYNNNFSEDNEGNYIQKMINAEILVLDDIASEVNPLAISGKVSDFSARILYSVMDARSELKPTIITSNISWNELQKVIDPRVASRMSYRLRVLSFYEIKDKRKNKVG